MSEPGKLRLEVSLYDEPTTRETNYGPREERDRLVHLDLPVTHAAWRYIEQLETQRALLEDIYAWGATVAAEKGSYIFELFERIRPLVVPNPASERDA